MTLINNKKLSTVKSYLYSFSRFNRVYENLEDSAEEENLVKLYQESVDYLMAEIKAGTADGSSFLKWIDTVCDIVDSTKMKGPVMAKVKSFMNTNVQLLSPMMKEAARYPKGSAEAKKMMELKKRFTELTVSDKTQTSRAEELQRKYGLM